MTDLSGYDFDDHLIRDMVRTCHVPCEEVITSSQGTTVSAVQCEKCRNPWPCPAVTAYREWEATHATDTTSTAASN